MSQKELLQSFGITKKDILTKVVDQIVTEVLGGHGFDESGEPLSHNPAGIMGKIQEETQKCIKETIDAAISGHIFPTVQQLVKSHKIEETNKWNEARKPPMSIAEYIGTLAGESLSERVDSDGKTVHTNSYDSNRYMTRLQYFVAKETQNEIKKAVEKMMADANALIIKAVKDTIESHTESVLKSLKR